MEKNKDQNSHDLLSFAYKLKAFSWHLPSNTFQGKSLERLSPKGETAGGEYFFFYMKERGKDLVMLTHPAFQMSRNITGEQVKD